MTAIQKFYKWKLLWFIMNSDVLMVLGIFLVGLMGIAGASSSTTMVDFIIDANNGSDAEAFNCMVGGLDVDDEGYDWISLDWENCEDDRFLHNLIFVDGFLVGEVSGEEFNVTGLSEDTRYEFSIISISNESEEGVRAAVLGRTLERGDDEDRREGGRYSTRDDVIPNFFVSEDKIFTEDVVILLENSSVVEEVCDWWVLLWWVLGLLIFVLLALIFILLLQ